MVSGYDLVVLVSLSDDAEWIPSEMKFDDLYPGWDIRISKQGFNATRRTIEEPTQTESAQFQLELKEVAKRLLDALTYLMGVRTRHSEHRPSSNVRVRGPSSISLSAKLQSSYSLTVCGSAPTVGDIQRFWHDLPRNQPYREAINYYLGAVRSTTESDVAIQLYKAIETLEKEYGGQANATKQLRYSSQKWKRLKRNLNWRRHVEKKFEAPSTQQRMSTDECLNEVRTLIEQFREQGAKG